MLVKMLDNFDKSTYDAIRDKLQRYGRGRRNAVLGERLEVEAPQLNKYRVEKYSEAYGLRIQKNLLNLEPQLTIMPLRKTERE